jgi:3-dehydroquinate synthase
VTVLTRTISLPTYTVAVARGALGALAETVRRVAPAHRYAVISDTHVAPHYAARVVAMLGASSQLFTIPAGEAHKTRETWASITDEMLAAGLGRDTTVIALGGGVVGDLAGFVAATFMRGVPYVQVPTSLLAMIDASIGGKTGVDTPAGKNLVGAFHQPSAVVADPDVLQTLPPEHMRGGLAEAIKHGVIADAGYFESVVNVGAALGTTRGAGDAITDLVARGIEIKANVVRQDEREAGVRKTLNFGHTLGHAIELCSDYRVLHGDAVAIGMVLESALAERMALADSGTSASVRSAVERVGLPAAPPRALSLDDIVRATHGDKKARAGRAEYALPQRIGAMAGGDRGWAIPVPDELVRDVVAAVTSR